MARDRGPRPDRPGRLSAAGVFLPDGTRVLADGLDAHCWPGSEPAFRDELGSPSPESWHRGPRTGGGDVAADASAAMARYVGIEARALPVAAVLDPATRRGVVISLPRGGRSAPCGRSR